MSVRLFVLLASAASLVLGACAPGHDLAEFAVGGDMLALRDGPAPVDGYPVPVAPAVADASGWRTASVIPARIDDGDGRYLLDTGDRLRIFVYGQPNLSRLYVVDHDGHIGVPLIGNVTARGKTINELQTTIRSRLATQFVKDPQVTVDIQQNRPFFILGEVKSAGQYPYVSGMTVETAVAIAGGYTERASESSFRVTRRVNGGIEQLEVPSQYMLKPGDTVYVFKRFF
jgi:polysaccharide export outer membrane protein